MFFGERGRSGGRSLAEALMRVFASYGVGAAVVLRGGEGFGPRQGFRTSSGLTLSEDLPMVAVAVDSPATIASVATEVAELLDEGLLTLEPVMLAGNGRGPGAEALPGVDSRRRLTVWLDRHARVGRSSAYAASVAVLHKHGADAAIVLLGIDGLADGARHRAGFFSANRRVPMLLSAVGGSGAIDRARQEIGVLLPTAMFETSDVRLAGGEINGAGPVPPGDGPSTERNLRLSIYAGGLDAYEGIRQQELLLRVLRRAGAPGATALQGFYGFRGKQPPHGESFWSLRRRIPVLTEVIDRPDACRRRLEEIESVTGNRALVVVAPVERLSRPAGRA